MLVLHTHYKLATYIYRKARRVFKFNHNITIDTRKIGIKSK